MLTRRPKAPAGAGAPPVAGTHACNASCHKRLDVFMKQGKKPRRMVLAADGDLHSEALGKGDASRPNPRWPGTATVVLCFSVGDKAGEKLLEKRLGCDVGPRNLGIVRFEAASKETVAGPRGGRCQGHRLRPAGSPGCHSPCPSSVTLGRRKGRGTGNLHESQGQGAGRDAGPMG